MRIRRALGCLLLFSLLCVPPAFAKSGRPERPPNIVLIVGDDHGYPYAGFMGDEIVETPNLDRLAEGGTTFTHAFASASVCQPALQTLLSGLHQRSWERQRFRTIVRTILSLGHSIPRRAEVSHYVTLPRQLARQGYRSFQGGKHWEGDFRMAGFDAGTATEPSFGPLQLVGHDTFGRQSLEPMDTFLDGVDDAEPFFLFLAPMLPHVPLDPSPDLLDLYRGRGLVNSAVYYYANVTRLDDVVGQIVETLAERGLRDDSLIIYVSDNGWEQAPYENHFFGSNLGGDRGKMSIHELGFRTPLIFNWPGDIPRGKVLDDLVTFEDLHATILRYAGAPIPPDHRGNDLVPRIHGSSGAERDHVIGLQDALRVRESEYDPAAGLGGWIKAETGSFVRTPQWRYVEWLNRGERALYRIEEDPFERTDVSAEHPELLTLFAERARIWRSELTRPADWMDAMGQLSDADGTPAPGLRLWLEHFDEPDEHPRWEIFANDRGFFRFPNVRADVYRLSYEIVAPERGGRWDEPVGDPTTKSRTLSLVGWQTSPFLSIQIPGEAPPGRSSGQRPGAIEVELLAKGAIETSGLPIHVRGWTRSGFVEQRVVSGPDGFVAIDQLPAGFYFVTVTPPADVLARRQWTYLRPGHNRSMEIKLRSSDRPRWPTRSSNHARRRR